MHNKTINQSFQIDNINNTQLQTEAYDHYPLKDWIESQIESMLNPIKNESTKPTLNNIINRSTTEEEDDANQKGNNSTYSKSDIDENESIIVIDFNDRNKDIKIKENQPLKKSSIIPTGKIFKNSAPPSPEEYSLMYNYKEKDKEDNTLYNYKYNYPFTIGQNDPEHGLQVIKQNLHSKKPTQKQLFILENVLNQFHHISLPVFNYFKGTFSYLIKNQQASRLLQYYFDNTPNEIIHQIYDEIKKDISKLLIDPYANYFCLKLFYFLNDEKKLDFILRLKNDFFILAVNKISTYPIQCIIENMKDYKQKKIIISCLNEGGSNGLIKLCFDLYGTHVVEKVLHHFEYELIKEVVDCLIGNFMFLAFNSNGLCVAKLLVVWVNVYKKKNDAFNININESGNSINSPKTNHSLSSFTKVKSLLITNALPLIQNPYGNYVLQTAIENWDLEDTEEFMFKFCGNLSVFSLQKFSSNVIERCLEKSKNFYLHFVNEIIKDNGVGSLLINSYGNYVIQTALKNSHGLNQLLFIKNVEGNLGRITDEKLLGKWREIVGNAYEENGKKFGNYNNNYLTFNNNGMWDLFKYNNNNNNNFMVANNVRGNMNYQNMFMNNMNCQCGINNNNNLFVVNDKFNNNNF